MIVLSVLFFMSMIKNGNIFMIILGLIVLVGGVLLGIGTIVCSCGFEIILEIMFFCIIGSSITGDKANIHKIEENKNVQQIQEVNNGDNEIIELKDGTLGIIKDGKFIEIETK